MFSCYYDVADAGDDANTDIGTQIKVCGMGEFTEKMQAKRAGNQKYSGGVSMFKLPYFKIMVYQV
jgi:hypothetical protein